MIKAGALVFSICFLDQISKISAENLLPSGESMPMIKGVFHLTLIHNTGAAFGLLSAWPEFFIFLSIVALLSIPCYFYFRGKDMDIFERFALVFIFSGTLGNLIDRIRLGYVIDFIDLRVWPVFNIADSFITIGAGMLVWSVFRKYKDENIKGDDSASCSI